MTQPSSSTSRKNVLPYVLIGLGVLVLLGNLGLFRFDALLDAVINVLNLWPVALIAIGADMVTRGKHRALIAAAAVIAGVVILMAGVGIGGGVDARSNDVAIALAGASRADVRLQAGVATLDLTTGDGGGDVLWGTIQTGRGETLNSSSRVSGDTVIVSVASEHGYSVGFPGRERVWDLTLDDEVPTTLNVRSGVGRSTLDLRDLDLRGLQMDAGVGEVTVTLPDEGVYSGSINAGVGSVAIRVPQDAAVRLTVRAGLGRVNVRGGFTQDGDVYTSPAYRAGEPSAELRVEGGVGEVDIETVR
jgi:hypothetical protein